MCGFKVQPRSVSRRAPNAFVELDEDAIGLLG